MENEKKKTMIVEEDNTIYEIDLECVMRKKREKEEEKRQAVEEETRSFQTQLVKKNPACRIFRLGWDLR